MPIGEEKRGGKGSETRGRQSASLRLSSIRTQSRSEANTPVGERLQRRIHVARVAQILQTARAARTRSRIRLAHVLGGERATNCMHTYVGVETYCSLHLYPI